MRFVWVFAVGVSMLAPKHVVGQDQLPPIVEAGFDMLMSSGPDSAIDYWTAAWTSADDQLKQAQLKGAFRPLWASLGPAESYEIVHVDWIGSWVAEVFAVTAHPQQPLFFYLRAYRAPDGWMISQVNANTLMSEVFPEWVMRGGSE
jgi:hypothetical protein